jgi:hypothetical protein
MKRLSLLGIFLIVIGLVFVIYTIDTSEHPFNLSEAREEKYYTFETDDITGRIRIEETNADIYISLSSDNRIHLKTFENDDEYYEVTSDKDLTIVYKRNLKWYQRIMDISFLGEDFRYTLELDLPESLISDIDIDAVNNNLYIDDITANTLNIDKTNGNIRLTHVDSVKDMTIDSVNGNIELNDVISNEDMEIDSTNGNIELNSIDFGDTGFIETTNGNVVADLIDSGDNFTFDISTVNGSTSISYGDVDRSGKSVFYGNGDKKLIVETTNGNIKLICKP